MANLTGNLKDSVTATFPREFDIPNAMTLGEIYDRLNERASAFQMPFSVKGGVPGERIVFAKEPNLDVTIWLHVKNGTHIKITPVTQSSSATINGIDVGKNSVMRKGIKGVASRPMLQGQYIDGVTDTIKKILADEAVADYVPESLYEIVDYIVTSIYNGGRVALTVSILLTLWSASACMKALLRGMDSVYDAERREDYIRFSLRACFYMVIFVFILLLSFFVMVYGGQILDMIEDSMPANHSLDFLFTLAKHLRFLIILALLAMVFSLLYKWMPAKNLKYRRQLPGAVFSAVVWAAFSFIFSFYVSLSDKFGAYGYIGTIMVAMIWIFYCFYFLLMGGFINHYIEMKRAGPEK